MNCVGAAWTKSRYTKMVTVTHVAGIFIFTLTLIKVEIHAVSTQAINPLPYSLPNYTGSYTTNLINRAVAAPVSTNPSSQTVARNGYFNPYFKDQIGISNYHQFDSNVQAIDPLAPSLAARYPNHSPFPVPAESRVGSVCPTTVALQDPALAPNAAISQSTGGVPLSVPNGSYSPSFQQV